MERGLTMSTAAAMAPGRLQRPLRDLALDAIRSRIVSGIDPPGSRLVEDRLATELGMSRNPVREALRVLAAEGYVEMIPRRGAVVATISDDEASEIFELRMALEALAARLAARKAVAGDGRELSRLLEASRRAAARQDAAALPTLNTQFHEEVLRLAKNGHLRNVMIPLRGRMQWIFSHTAAGARGPHSVAEHEALAAAILARDEDRAAALAGAHIAAARESFLGFRRDGNTG